jgi:hypothetical protein
MIAKMENIEFSSFEEFMDYLLDNEMDFNTLAYFTFNMGKSLRKQSENIQGLYEIIDGYKEDLKFRQNVIDAIRWKFISEGGETTARIRAQGEQYFKGVLN